MEKEIKVTPLYFDHVFGADYDAVIEVGGRYSGKSYNSQIEEVCNLASKENYKLLIIQDLDKGGSDGYYAGIVDKIEQFEHTPAYNITTSSTKITNKINGNTVLFRGYKTDQQKKDVKNIDQVTKIVVEEGEWMTFDDFLALVQQLRGKVKEDRRLDILLNPVNTECFVNKEIIMKPPTNVLMYFPNSNRPKVFERHIEVNTVDLEGKSTKLSIKILVVLSTHFDNPHLTGIQRASIEVYRTTNPEKYKQLGEAKFIQSSGAFFKEFNDEIHVIEPFAPPSHWPVYTTMDYGLDMQATYAVAFDPEDTMYIFRRVYKPNQIISQAAQNNLDMLKGLKSIYNYGPPDLMKRQQSNGRTTWEMFSEYGWKLDETSNRREEGCLAMKERFKVYERKMEDGTSKLDSKIKITSDCYDLIRTIKQVLTHKKNANVYAAHGSEIEGMAPSNYHELTHAPDAIRYICIMHRVNKIVEEVTEDKADEYFEEVMTW
jgi:PBSX family phage terminase large subunit